MAFDLTIWQQKAGERLQAWRPRMQQVGVHSVYAFVSAAALWPVVQAAQQGEWAALAALGGVVSGLGSNLLANQIQNWKNEPDAARQLAAQVERDEALRAELDEVLKKLDAISLARAGLPAEDQAWFTKTLSEELARLGNQQQFKAQLKGSGAIAQGPGAMAAGAGGVVVGGNVGGSVITGSHSRTIDTGGGAYVEGQVNTGGGDFVGRDKISRRDKDEDE